METHQVLVGCKGSDQSCLLLYGVRFRGRQTCSRISTKLSAEGIVTERLCSVVFKDKHYLIHSFFKLESLQEPKLVSRLITYSSSTKLYSSLFHISISK